MAAKKTADVAPAPAAPAATAAPAVTVAAAEPAASASTVSSPLGDAGPAGSAFPSPDEFGWDDWDGDTYDPFPEPIRPWAERLNGRYKSKHEETMAGLAKEKEIYESLAAGLEDPRLKDLKGQVEGHDKFKRTAAENFRALIADNERLVKALEDRETRAAEAEFEDFRSKNAWVFDNGKNQHAANELFQEGFGLDVLPEVLKLSAASLDKLKAHHKEMVADGVKNAARYALALVKAESQPPPPSAAAELISGARAPNSGPTKPAKPPANATLREKELEAARRAFGRR